MHYKARHQAEKERRFAKLCLSSAMWVMGPVNACFYPVPDPDLEIRGHGWGCRGGGGSSKNFFRSFGTQFGRVPPLDPSLLSTRNLALQFYHFLFLTLGLGLGLGLGLFKTYLTADHY